MKKLIKFLSIILITILLVGCEKKTETTKPVNNEPEIKISKLKEGKYTQIAPSKKNSQGDGYDTYLTLENGKATEFESSFGMTTEGTYTINDNIITVHYTRNYGMTTYGEPYDDKIDRTFTYHIEDNKVILDKMSDFDAYEKGSVIYELK